MPRTTTLVAALAATALGTLVATAAEAAEVTMLRFFGDCANEYGNVTDITKADGECGIIQVLTNEFNATNKIGAKVVTQTVDWQAYYDLLSASYSTGNIPDVAIMHRSVLPDFTSRSLIEPIGQDLEKAGVDFADFVPAARDAVTIKDKVYALPFDVHALLVHVNMDLLRRSGLATDTGRPILPRSPQELLDQAKKVKDATGKLYLGMESDSAGKTPTRLFDSWVWQQGAEVIAPDASGAAIDSPPGLKAADLLQKIYAQNVTNKAFDYAGSEQAFLNGDVAVLVNGTWGVDKYTAHAASGSPGLHDYRVADLPQLFDRPATWADSHTWTVPTNPNRSPEKRAAAIAFLKFLNDNDLQWARTGSLPVRRSVLESDAFRKLPHRAEYADTIRIAHSLPAIRNQRSIQDDMVSELSAIWLTGREPASALEQMQSRVERDLRRARR